MWLERKVSTGEFFSFLKTLKRYFINILLLNQTNCNTKSTKTVLKHPEKYHVKSAIKLGDYNVGKYGRMKGGLL